MISSIQYACAGQRHGTKGQVIRYGARSDCHSAASWQSNSSRGKKAAREAERRERARVREQQRIEREEERYRKALERERIKEEKEAIKAALNNAKDAYQKRCDDRASLRMDFVREEIK